MGILHAVVTATTMLLITFAWQLTLEVEAIEEVSNSGAART